MSKRAIVESSNVAPAFVGELLGMSNDPPFMEVGTRFINLALLGSVRVTRETVALVLSNGTIESFTGDEADQVLARLRLGMQRPADLSTSEPGA